MNVRTAFTALTVVGLAVVAPVTANASTTSEHLHAKLSGSQVVPGPGDSAAKGTFKATIKGDQFCYKVHVKKTDVTGVTIGQGEAGATGDVVVVLDDSRGCTTIVADEDDTDATLSEYELAALLANPGQYYVQVTSDEFPNGAARGQLR